MPDLTTIQEFLDQRHIAFVGVSRDSKQFANDIYRRMRNGGRVLYPVNEKASGPIEGDRSFSCLRDVPDPLDGVVIMVPPDAMAGMVDEVLVRGVPRVWFHRGLGQHAIPEDLVTRCREAGVTVVDGACPLMFMEPVRGVHRMHRALAHRRLAA